MSIEALNWAFKQKIKPSSLKFVLVAMCDYASENGEAFPSIETLSKKTSQDRKTVIKNVEKLRDLNVLLDTGYRRGSTNQVVVYKILYGEDLNSTENGTVPFLLSKSPKNGTAKESQKRYTEPPVVNHQLEPSVNNTEATGNLTVLPPVEVEKVKKQIPYSAIVQMYHSQLSELPAVAKLTETRKRYIKNLYLDDLPTKKDWEDFFEYVKQSDFLMGRSQQFGDRKPFIASLEWITKPANFVKILESNYHE